MTPNSLIPADDFLTALSNFALEKHVNERRTLYFRTIGSTIVLYGRGEDGSDRLYFSGDFANLYAYLKLVQK